MSYDYVKVTAITSKTQLEGLLESVKDVLGENNAAVLPSRAVESDASGYLKSSSVTSLELGYLSGLTGSLTALLADKVNNTGDETIDDVKTFSSAPKVSTLTANKIVLSSGTKELVSSSLAEGDLPTLAGDNTFTGKNIFSTLTANKLVKAGADGELQDSGLEEGDLPTLAGENTFTAVGKNIFGTVAEFDNGATKKLGFFGVTAVAKQSMLADYTLTQQDVAGTTAEDLTDNTGGNATGSTLVAIGGTYDQAEVANNMAVMAKMIDALTVTVGSLTTELNKAKTDIAALQDRIEELVDINAIFGLASQP